MTHTFYIGNDIATAESVQIFCEEDFVRMVDERPGRDASNYINSIIEQRNDAIKERNEAIKDVEADCLSCDAYECGYDDGLTIGEESYK